MRPPSQATRLGAQGGPRLACPELRFLDGPFAGREVPLTGPYPITFGSAPDARVRLPEPEVSPEHARLQRRPDGSLVFEDCSATASSVDRRLLQRRSCPLTGVHRIVIGPHLMEVRLIAPEPARAAARETREEVGPGPLADRTRGWLSRTLAIAGIPASAASRSSRVWVVPSLLVIWVVVWIVANVARGLGLDAVQGVVAALMLRPSAILGGSQVWGLATYALVHVSALHLLLNGSGLYLVGLPLEREVGWRRWLVFFWTGVLGGSLLSVLGACVAQSSATESPNVTILGGSAGLCGLFVLFAVLHPRATVYLMFIPVRAWLLVIVILGLDAVGLLAGGSAVAHLAHIGGTLAALGLVGLLHALRRTARSSART